MSKIPQGEWSAIAARHAQGESLSAIARSYGCTPPAIHYVLKRSGRQAPEKVEPPAEAAPSRSNEPHREAPPPTLRPNGEIRLSLNRSNEPAGGGSRQSAPLAIGLHTEQPPVAIEPDEPVGGGSRQPAPLAIGLHTKQPPVAIEPARSEQQPTAELQQHPGSPRPTGRAMAATDGLDSELHERAEAAIETFRSCFEAVLAEGSPHERARLRQAASDLMRVAARTTIVLDRLNALSERTAARFDPRPNKNWRT